MSGRQRATILRIVAGPIAVVVSSYGVYRVIEPVRERDDWARWLGVAAALVVGAVLVFAGASKLAARQYWREQAAELGVPRSLMSVVPIAELIVGALSIVGVGWSATPWLAVTMFVGFGVFIATKLGTGQQPSCACFGAWSARPISERDLWRNAGLTGLALLSLLR